MTTEELIPAGEFCTFHHVEISFLQTLHSAGLITMIMRDGVVFLEAGQLPEVEKFARWHYELAINPEGIEALSHILGRLDQLLTENRQLRNRLRRYESGFNSGTTIDYP